MSKVELRIKARNRFEKSKHQKIIRGFYLFIFIFIKDYEQLKNL
jgi:hypothetical protein